MLKLDILQHFRRHVKLRYKNRFTTNLTLTFTTSDSITCERSIMKLMQILTVVVDDSIYYDGILVQERDHCHVHLILATATEMSKDRRSFDQFEDLANNYKTLHEDNSKCFRIRDFFENKFYKDFSKSMSHGDYAYRVKFAGLDENEIWIDYLADQPKRHLPAEFHVVSNFIQRRSGRRRFCKKLADRGIIIKDRTISFTDANVFRMLNKLHQKTQY